MAKLQSAIPRKRQFWVVSPNVNGSHSRTRDQWPEVIRREQAVFMGKAPKARKGHGRGGQLFAENINEQDIVLIAHGRERWVVGWGVVVSKAKVGSQIVYASDGSALYYRTYRKLASFQSNKSKPQFPDVLRRHIPGYNSESTHAIYKFHENKVGQKKACDWLESHLGKPKSQATRSAGLDDALEEKPPPKKIKPKSKSADSSGNPPPPPDAQLGTDGELLVLKYERERLLAAGRADLRKRVRHVAQDKGGTKKGFDILSFDPINGAERHIEVKTTRGPAARRFYLTKQEVRSSEQHPSSYYLYRVYFFEKSPALFYKIRGRLRDNFELEPMVFRASR